MITLDLKDAYQRLFWEETNSQILALETDSLELENGDFSAETIDRMFRMAHSMKGSSATIGAVEIMRVSHLLEDLLGALKTNAAPIDKGIIELIFEALDLLKWLHDLTTIKQGVSDAAFDVLSEVEEMTQQLEASVAALLLVLTENSGKRLLEPADLDKSSNEALTEIVVKFEADAEMLSVKAYQVVLALSQISKVEKTVPTHYEDEEDLAFKGEFRIFIKSDVPDNKIKNALSEITEIKHVEVIQATNKNKSLKASVQSGDVSSVRISNENLNQMMNLVGELILNKETIGAITRAFKTIYPKDKNVLRLESAVESFQDLTNQLQEIVLSTRMIPLESIFNRFPRMVRDYAVKANKKIRLEMVGINQGIDKGVAEEIYDPIVHLLRNAIDHGIETDVERVQTGKFEEGVIRIEAKQGENQMIITIEDDGRGIDIQNVKVKAMTQGLISYEEAEYLTDQEWLNFIFSPGFSTASEVTEVSGRGVGLDVVKNKISKLSGQIEFESEANKGTRFVMRLPMTLSIMNVILVREESCIFGVPSAQVIEVIRLSASECQQATYKTAYSEVLKWKETSIPVVYLSRQMGLPEDETGSKRYFLIVGVGEKRFGLSVGRILGEQEVVIKSMKSYIGERKIFGPLDEIMGVSILGNGNLVQIIDVSTFNKG